MLIPDFAIEELSSGKCRTVLDGVVIDNQGKPMLEPFISHSNKTNDNNIRIPSYGLSSFGYDVRLAPEFKLFTKPNDGRVIDIMNFDEGDFVEEVKADSVVLPPGGLLLSRTVEYFRIPDNVMATCSNKSTWARLGMFSLVTPLEPGWEGNLVIEITNCTNLPMRIYAGVGIAQIEFKASKYRPKTTYGDRGGKYQGQTGITGSKL